MSLKNIFTNKHYTLNKDIANYTLQNVLLSCEQIPGEKSLDEAIKHSAQNARKKLSPVVICVILFIFVLFFILGFIIGKRTRIASEKKNQVRLEKDYDVDNILYLDFSGKGIIFDEAYMETRSGHKYDCEVIDKKSQLLTFPYIENEEANIYIPVKGKKTLHFLITPEGIIP